MIVNSKNWNWNQPDQCRKRLKQVGSSHEAIAVHSCDQIQATMPAAEMATGKSIASELVISAFAQHQPNLQGTQKNCYYKCFRARSLSKRVPEFLELRTVENRCTLDSSGPFVKQHPSRLQTKCCWSPQLLLQR